MMNKKILVHCSTNWQTSNFGDVLFAEMILSHLVDRGYQAALYDPSDYVTDYLYNVKKLPRYSFHVKDADACVYFAGGYFGELRDSKLKYRLKHFIRFMIFGLNTLLHKKKTAVIGVGAGPYLWLPSRAVVRHVCKKACVVATRDEESTLFLKKIGVDRCIVTCSDIAQTIERDQYPKPDWMNEQNQYVYLHVNNSKSVAELFALGLSEYVKSHPDVKVIVGNDYRMRTDEAFGVVKDILGEAVIQHAYTYPDELCSVLSACSLVLTYKLHVGIIASIFGKSVLSFYMHEKIPRYYKQIGHGERCMAFSDVTPDDVGRRIKKYAENDMAVPAAIIEKAEQNWRLLDEFLETV